MGTQRSEYLAGMLYDKLQEDLYRGYDGAFALAKSLAVELYEHKGMRKKECVLFLFIFVYFRAAEFYYASWRQSRFNVIALGSFVWALMRSKRYGDKLLDHYELLPAKRVRLHHRERFDALYETMNWVALKRETSAKELNVLLSPYWGIVYFSGKLSRWFSQEKNIAQLIAKYALDVHHDGDSVSRMLVRAKLALITPDEAKKHSLRYSVMSTLSNAKRVIPLYDVGYTHILLGEKKQAEEIGQQFKIQALMRRLSLTS